MITIPEQIRQWDTINADHAYFPVDPDPWIVERLKDEQPNKRKAVDLGCGHGRHLDWLAHQGWRVTGIDWSQNAIRYARARLTKQQSVGEFVNEDFRRLTIPDNQFQIAVAIRTLNHLTVSGFQRTMHEIKRMMRIGGKLYFNVPSIRNAPLDICLGTWIEPMTLSMESGREAHIPHHFFTAEELAKQAILWRHAEIETVIEPMPPGVNPLHETHLNEWHWVTLTR